MTFTLHSSSFTHMGKIPSLYTREGKDISPPLEWHNPPTGTVCYALIVDDPDAPDPKAPRMTWVHWILFNIPAHIHSLKEAISNEELPQGTQEGITDCPQRGYGGPYPPIGTHRYFFKLYALSKKIHNLQNPRKKDLEKAMEGLILGKAELIGTYTKTDSSTCFGT